MENRLKILILGKNAALLEKNCERLKTSHPIDISYFTELKDFLEQCISLQPDIVGISFSYPHKSIAQFPRIIEMAVNVPVIVFGEDRDNKVIQSIIASQTQYKITGGMTAQNMWVQISKYLKNKELAEQELNGEEDQGHDSNKKNNNTVFLKGESRDKSNLEKNSLLSSLFSSLNAGEQGSAAGLIKSSEATEYKKSATNHINTSDTKGLFDDNPDEVSKGKNSNEKEKEENKLDPKNYLDKNKKDNLFSGKDEKNENVNPSRSGQLIDFNQRKNEIQNNKSLNENLNQKQNSLNKNNSLHAKNGMSPEYSEELEKENSQRTDKKGAINKTTKSSDNSAHSDKEDSNYKQKKDINNNNSKADQSKNNNNQVALDKNPIPKTDQEGGGAENNTQNADNDKNKEKKEASFGSIKLADEKEVKENIRKKKKQKKEKEQTESKNLLLESCDIAFKKCFSSKQIENPRVFDTESVNVFIIETQSLKGFLFLANSFKRDLETQISEEFRSTIIENFKKNGMGIEISYPLSIKILTEDYPMLVKNFSEFILSHEEENGKQQVASFMQREVVQPQVEPSEKEEMYFIDIKTIPPQTKVNFDAFIYLPKNERYVRYLKEGRSLSLEQAKRQSEILKNSKLYLPKEQKQKFIEFFVQNTIDWEVAITKSKIAI